jgi:chemotaxis protein MotB
VKPGEEDTKAHELVLIRRRAPAEDGGHHGGVWKIAYADFMTAMMAFFLVMWLINSTDQKVLTQVANYFNPMRLTDSAPHSRGLHTVESGEQGKPGKQNSSGDPKEKEHSKEKNKEKPRDKAQDKAQDKAKEKGKDKAGATTGDGKEDSQAGTPAKARFTEQALFSDPYGVLARIAADAPDDALPPAPVSKVARATAADVYRDPFDPAAQQDGAEKRPTGPAAASGPDAKQTASPAGGGEAQTAPSPEVSPKAVEGAKTAQPPVASAEAKVPDDAAVPKEATQPADKAGEQALQEIANAAKRAFARAAAQKTAAEDEAGKIEDEIKRVTSQLSGTLPNIDVVATDDGVLISLTDDYDFGMFAIASAEPRPAMVVIMEKIAKVLQAHRQPLIVRGHTDGRRYHSGAYDNWRLSTARAHMAYYMLVRGGIDEKRFERVEGHADRSLRIPGNPDAAQNRRIEILLRRPKQ